MWQRLAVAVAILVLLLSRLVHNFWMDHWESSTERDEAVAKATEILRAAARTAALPEWPVSRVEAVSEDEEDID